ncbi:PaNox3 NADPH oxidase encoded by the PaNox3 protein [Podospora aff. communis PSN243]|uniref:PaNox3 NADPH oxidase encoded by the PaNox3 protein n=1 Tax=Podospora aff. communis PSN243 TaxID=3040156 RepID=A0AAV9G7B2_9PEZI|nr:PaNox3 NADPH oxidase encoded by the PaNox3 protein [Podospora aff. communis PSN243]
MARDGTAPWGDVRYLTDDEVNAFLNDLDHNGDGMIDYDEVERKLDQVHAEIAPSPSPHHLHHNSNGDAKRHAFLRKIIGSDKNRIPRDEFAERVRSWKIPSLNQDKDMSVDQKAYLSKLGIFRRVRSYWAVHGPEIAFLALVISMQLAFGIWQLVKYLTGEHYTRAFGWGVVLAKTCAGMLYPTLFFLILSMSRYLSTFLRRSYYISRFINWDMSQAFHITISCVAVTLATLHAIGHLSGSFVWGSRPENEDTVALLLGPDAVPRPYIAYVRSLPGFTGLAALGLFYVLCLLSIPQVRRKSYEAFQLGHLLMYPIIGLLMAHGTAGLLQWPMLGYWLAFPTLLVLMERVVRVYLGFRQRVPATIQILDNETVLIKAAVPSERMWQYQAGQYVFLQVPKISYFQWHPFTVSTCIGKEFQLHIKTDGNWTSQLRKLCGEGSGTETAIQIGINGPFGAPAQRFYDFSHSIVVGSGIGVTPFSGILVDLQEKDDKEQNAPAIEKARQTTQPRDTLMEGGSGDRHPSTFAPDYRRIDFHWTVRDRNSLLWLSDLLNRVSQSQQWHAEHDEQAHLDIRIHTHITQKRDQIATHVYRWLLEMHRTPEHPTSPLTGLLNPTHFGRPDFVRILDHHYEEMKRYKAVLAEKDPEQVDEEFKVGVFFCGTPVVGEILADRCRLLSARGREDGSKVEYHFMMEVFG